MVKYLDYQDVALVITELMKVIKSIVSGRHHRAHESHHQVHRKQSSVTERTLPCMRVHGSIHERFRFVVLQLTDSIKPYTELLTAKGAFPDRCMLPRYEYTSPGES